MPGVTAFVQQAPKYPIPNNQETATMRARIVLIVTTHAPMWHTALIPMRHLLPQCTVRQERRIGTAGISTLHRAGKRAVPKGGQHNEGELRGTGRKNVIES